MAETLNERLDRIELSIATLTQKVNDIKPSNTNKTEVTQTLNDPESTVKRLVTRDFVTKLYRG